jgi:DNA invertase Pin-like site-specific DNA recombinase
MATGIYVRVSHKSQDTKSQEMDLRTWAKSQDDEVVWYRDQFTGTQMERPGLDRLLAGVRCGKITRIACWRLDRLGRTAKGLLNLLDELRLLNVQFISLREGFDLATPAGRLMAGMLASVAAYETEVRKERQLLGIAKAKAAGKTWGGRNAGTRIRLTAEKEKLIHQLHDQKTPIRVISRMVELAPHTIYKAIRRRDGASIPQE